jgi:hypothetical protein
MSSWLPKLLLKSDGSTRLLIEGPDGDVLKARLPRPSHPRALLTMLEGAALWAGTPLSAAISAEGRPAHTSVEALFGGEWPAESALVHFVAGEPRSRRRTRIHGVGDFRQVHLLVPERR